LRLSSNQGDEEHVTTVADALPNLESAKFVVNTIPESRSRTVPVFLGDDGYGAILDAAGEVNERHFHIPVAAEKALAAEDLQYLKAKGCFSLPTESKELLKAYFQFVHPTFPVIDGPAFLRDYAASGLEGINLLLLWSMFSVSASYIPLQARRAVKECYIHRAKLLFDLSEEKDKLVLVQSALLLSFWFADTEDVKQSWYWTSIAFGIAQTLGLHREVKLTQNQVSIAQRRLWRNAWWCCIIRDVWLAFGMGRPLRLNVSDCDITLPQNSDSQFVNMILHDKLLHSPEEAAGFAIMWESLITASNVLREVLTKNTPSFTMMESLEIKIDAHVNNRSTPLLAHVHGHLQLHQNAALIALAQSKGNKETLRAAADNTTAILETFLVERTTVYAAPFTISLVVPAMVTYLRALRSRESKITQLANDQLETYWHFLTAIETNYPAASIVKGLLDAARNSIAGKEDNQGVRRDQLVSETLDQSSSSWDSEWPFGTGQSLWSLEVDALTSTSTPSNSSFR
jgi:hypothetical protein